MSSLEVRLNHLPEIPQQNLDALIVPGKNIGVRHSPRSLQEQYYRLTCDLRTFLPNVMHIKLPQVAEGPLSLESALNVIAAGKLFNKGVAKKIIFTTGHTAGDDVPSEAQAMKNLLKEIFPQIPDSAIILEEKSKDTSGNAEEVSNIVWLNNFKRVGLVDVGFHLLNARTLLRRYRVGIRNEDSFVAEEILSQEAKDPKLFPKSFNKSKVVRKERLKEAIRSILLYTIDRKGTLLRKVAERTRK